MSQRILIIEDDAETLEMIELMLEDAGYQAIGHADHTTAYERIRDVHPDLVIMDLMDGLALAGWNTLMAASFDSDTREIPALLMSANTEYLRKNWQYLREHGCGTLEKPFHLEQLLAKVSAAVGGASVSAA